MTRPPAAVATFGRLTDLDAKMAHGILRYCDHVNVVVDPVHAGKRLHDLLPYAGRDIPVVATVAEAHQRGARELVVGASPPGGGAAPAMVAEVAAAAELGMWVVHGLHSRLTDVPELGRYRDRIVELRHRPVTERVATGEAARLTGNVVLTVASDCASGKMTTALEVWQGLRQRGADAEFVATGQTGMYIAGGGAPLDAVRADFAAGVVEQLVTDAAEGGARYVLVEGQGSILHPAYSGVSLSLLHGSAPNLLIFCHDLSRDRLAYFDQAVADVAEEIALLERLSEHQRKARVVAVVGVNRGGDPVTAEADRDRLERSLRLPVVPATTAGFGRLADLIAEF
ncbi:DUF1611 domain-containing protein [Actinoplanes sp. NPDC023801]|uniref:DUF1611 domain-containing protein n=1 Tax=Actinoplanes sp. NPDC023801 TaxID=3154595 RepID=UPI0033E11B79